LTFPLSPRIVASVKTWVNLGLFLIILVVSSCASTPAALPGNEDFRRGESCFLTGRFQEALDSYQRFLSGQAYSSHRVYTLCQVGLCALALGKNDQAIDHLRRALKTTREKPLKARVLVGLGNAYSGKENHLRAARYYSRALKETRNELNNETALLFKLATALMRGGKWAEGKKHLTELTKLKSAPRYLIGAAKTRLALPANTFVVQLGKFQGKDNALKCLKEFKERKGVSAELRALSIDNELCYFVWAGSFPYWQPARELAQELQAKGIEAIMIP